MEQAQLKIFQNYFALQQTGGIETLLRDWYQCTNPKKISMDFGSCLTAGAEDFIAVVKKRGNIFITGKGTHPFLKQLTYAIKLYKTLKKNKYDIFQMHIGWIPFLCIDSWVALLAGVKKRVVLVHSTSFDTIKKPFLKKFLRWILLHTHTHFLAVSTQAGNAFYGDNIPFTVISPGINTLRFAYHKTLRENIRKQLHFEHNFVIGHVGRFSVEKNHLFLLEIFNEICKIHPSSRLVLVGEGPQKQKIYQKAQTMNRQEQILCIGTQQDASPYYHAFDAFVFPSFYEGFGLAVLEAQTNGLPCFISDTLPPMVQICNVTRLSLQASPSQWAQAICKTHQEFVRKDCSLFVKQRGFDISNFVSKMENFYLQGTNL